MQDKYQKQWFALWERIGAHGDPLKPYNGLMERYSEPQRAYHTMEHIENCLDQLTEVRHFFESTDAVEMALLYHDVVYDPKAKDNEERSAEFLVASMKHASVSDDFSRHAATLIMATRHAAAPQGLDEQLIVDIDLSILGQSKEKFDEYERQVREEYAWVPEAQFKSSRSSILKSFLGRPAIFSTALFHDRYEEQARKNIARSIRKLSS